MKKIATAFFAATTSALLFAAPALATPTALAETDEFYAVDYDGHTGMPWKVIDPTTGESQTLDANYSHSLGGVYGGAYDPTTELGWTVARNIDNTRSLESFNLETGATNFVDATGEIISDGELMWQVAIDRNGNAWVLSSGNLLYSFDLTTGATVQVGTQPLTASWGFLSYDPSIDQVIYVDYVGGTSYTVSSVNTTDGTLTDLFVIDPADIPTVPAPDGGNTGTVLDALAIDSNGNYWWQVDNGFNSDIVVHHPATNSWTTNGWLYDSDNTVYAANYYSGTSAFYSMSYIVAYHRVTPPALAATGIDFGLVLSVTGVAVVTVAVGVSLRRRTRA